MDCPRLDCSHHDFMGDSCNLDGLHPDKESVLSIAFSAWCSRGGIFPGYYPLPQPLVLLRGPGQSCFFVYWSATRFSFSSFTSFPFPLSFGMASHFWPLIAIHH